MLRSDLWWTSPKPSSATPTEAEIQRQAKGLTASPRRSRRAPVCGPIHESAKRSQPEAGSTVRRLARRSLGEVGSNRPSRPDRPTALTGLTGTARESRELTRLRPAGYGVAGPPTPCGLRRGRPAYALRATAWQARMKRPDFTPKPATKHPCPACNLLGVDKQNTTHHPVTNSILKG